MKSTHKLPHLFTRIAGSTLLFCCFITSSCMQYYYLPALQASDIAYQPKPMTTDSVKKSTYLTGFFGHNGADESLSGSLDGSVFGELNVSRSYAIKRLNASYGGYVFLGTHTNKILDMSNPNYYQHKSFGGYGFRGSTNFVFPLGRTEIRFPGVEISYSKELGAYAAFRKRMLNQPEYEVNANTQLLSLGGSFEVIWHQRKDTRNRFSLRYFLGRTLTTGNVYLDGFNSLFNARFFFQYHKLGFILEESTENIRFGMTYKFK